MTQTMSQVMEQFLVNGLSIDALLQPYEDGFTALISISNKGVLPILGLTSTVELAPKSGVPLEKPIPHATFLTSEHGTEANRDPASPCSIVPGNTHVEKWGFSSSDLASVGHAYL